MARNITKFKDLDCTPIQVDLSRLDEGEGLENMFVRWKARWHKSCYDLFNSTKLKRAEKRQAREGIMLAELVSFSEESRTAELPVFRLTKLVDKYTSRLKQLGENTHVRIHTACLKDRILSQIPALKEHKQGCDVFFGHQNGSCHCTTESSYRRH